MNMFILSMRIATKIFSLPEGSVWYWDVIRNYHSHNERHQKEQLAVI